MALFTLQVPKIVWLGTNYFGASAYYIKSTSDIVCCIFISVWIIAPSAG